MAHEAVSLELQSYKSFGEKDLVIGLPKLEFTKDGPCDACQKGKQRKASLKSKTESSIV